VTTDTAPPFVHESAQQGVGHRILLWCIGAGLRVSLLFSPRPGALLVRRVFAAGGAKTAAALAKHAPADVVVTLDERYGDEPDMLLDLYRPAEANTPLPLVVWVHGGGFVGGAKEELAGYFKLLARAGYSVAAPRYSLAPEHRYPTPPRQVMQALAHLQADAERLQVDPTRIVLAGDSAGAHIAAQLGAIVTTPGYADEVGVAPAITPEQLRGLVLACGPYDLGLARHGSAFGRRLVQIVLWAYSGERDFLENPTFAAWSIGDHLTSAYPPTLLTVGNADPLRRHSEVLAERLRSHGVDTETLFFPEDHAPPLGHEYQFDLDGDAGQRFLRHALGFLERRLGAEDRETV
jgi:acetyl esterase/lipase